MFMSQKAGSRGCQEFVGWYVRLSTVDRLLSRGAPSSMAPHLVRIQGFPLHIGLRTRLSRPRLVLVGDSAETGPPFSGGLAERRAQSPPLMGGVIAVLAGAPAPGRGGGGGGGAGGFG